jgi:hypothetical protein
MTIEHEPEESVQVAGLGKVTVPVPDCVKVTVPVGDEPVTVAVQVEVPPTANDVGVQETEVLVVAFVTVRVDEVPELPALLESPP